ncbi:hypothetical protein ACIGXM_04480 [Kitasatospora sp. NPDC052896]|uniref:hypothetical protein n=1 Tax=Kitasatospora sp. NPDC052896 TaxID=3364061 RepID=UPI0037C6556A
MATIPYPQSTLLPLRGAGPEPAPPGRRRSRRRRGRVLVVGVGLTAPVLLSVLLTAAAQAAPGSAVPPWVGASAAPSPGDAPGTPSAGPTDPPGPWSAEHRTYHWAAHRPAGPPRHRVRRWHAAPDGPARHGAGGSDGTPDPALAAGPEPPAPTPAVEGGPPAAPAPVTQTAAHGNDPSDLQFPLGAGLGLIGAGLALVGLRLRRS